MGSGKDRKRLPPAAELRRQAEEKLRGATPERPTPLTEAETQKLLHELQVHQIELEMQNAELLGTLEELELSRNKNLELYDLAPVGYVTLTCDGTIRGANLTFAKLLGIERSRLIGRRFGQFVDPATRPAYAAFLERTFASQAKESCELALVKVGKPLLFAQVEAVAAASGEECRMVAVDITARRQLGEKLEALHNDLAVHAAELEASNIDLEAFNYSVSHDLRGPLTVIGGFCEVVEEMCGSKLDEKCLGYLRTIHESARKMRRLIDALLDFSRVKHTEMGHEQVDLSKMAEEVSLTLKVVNPERLGTFRIATGIMVDGDAAMLRVVLDNLIGNAWKFCGKRDKTVIEFGVTAVDGKPAYFVRDNGSGFDMKLADKLFLPFQRLPGAAAEGHGIGLATVDRIVKRHGGRVWAESQPGQGATFFFTLT